MANTRASALPFMAASIAGAAIYLGAVVLTADGWGSSFANRAFATLPTPFIVFSAHCAMSRRPKRLCVVLLAVLSALAWIVASQTAVVAMMGVPWSEVIVLLPESTLLPFVILIYMVVMATVIARSFLATETRLTLRTAFVILTITGALLAIIAKSQSALTFWSAMFFFYIPYVSLYGISVWCTARTRTLWPAMVLALVAGLGYGWAFDLYAAANTNRPVDWYLTASTGVYVVILLALLLGLRIADRYRSASHGLLPPAT